MEIAVHIEDLEFRYPGAPFPIFRGLNLDIRRGARFGLFGPNGAGKTTLMHLMTGILPCSNGSIRLLGQPPRHASFGFVPQDLAFYPELTPIQNLEFFGAWAGLRSVEIRSRARAILGVLGLADVADQRVEKFSGGMKRRLNLAIGVLAEPPILFLDEPTVGVDVQTGHAIVAYLRELNARGTTLVYTSHQLEEAEDLCEEIALIDEGALIAGGDLHGLLREHSQGDLQGLFLELTGKAYRDA